jgi:hypothetical protein
MSCLRQGVESLSHLMFDCPATSAQGDTIYDEIRSVLRDARGGAEKLRNVLSLTDASTKLRFVSDDVWGSRGGGVEWYLGALLSILFKLGICVINASIQEHCSLFLPLLRGAGPMALMLWLDEL